MQIYEIFLKNILHKIIIVLFIEFMFLFMFRISSIFYQDLIMLVLAVISYVCLSFIIRDSNKNKVLAIILVIFFTVVFVLGLFTILKNFNFDYSYDNTINLEESSKDFFYNKNILIFVPHQDDDLNLVEGVIERYVHGGSKVSVCFFTNGDYLDNAQVRIEEAIKVMSCVGVDKDNVYFLGFGDQWQPMYYENSKVNHIYNSPNGKLLWKSHSGYSSTYGTFTKPAYSNLPYTRDSVVLSMVNLIDNIRPQVIFVNDIDSHIDHKAVSLFFEEAMHEILKKIPNYTPMIYKGFCYSTAWHAEDDFNDNINIISTKQSDLDSDYEVNPYYLWCNRVRMPVYSGGLSRILTQTDAYKLLKLYESQSAEKQAGRITNGDKVFWERRTDSLLYNADIYVNGEKNYNLNDFKFINSDDISLEFMDGGTVIVNSSVDVILTKECDIQAIALYDDSDVKNNILSGYIQFDDGEKINFGKLNKNGTATYIDINKSKIKSFSVFITEYEGKAPALMEIEAYMQRSNYLIKDNYMSLVDKNDDFVYDYIIVGDNNEFTLYSYPSDISIEDVTIDIIDGDNDSYEIIDDKLVVHCEKNHSLTLKLTFEGISYCCRFSNLSYIDKLAIRVLQKLDYEYNFNPYTRITITGQMSYLKYQVLTHIGILKRFYVKAIS